MKNFKKAFTLVEMLIVIVIIGILAAALIPRLQSVQSRARDTSRKAHVAQIGSALAVYKSDVGNFSALSGTSLVSTLSTTLGSSGSYMTVVPTDSDQTSWNAGANAYSGIVGYAVASMARNGVNDSAIALMARTETDGASSNWVTSGSTIGGLATGSADIANLEAGICPRIAFGTATATGTNGAVTANTSCSAVKSLNVLRYIYLQ